MMPKRCACRQPTLVNSTDGTENDCCAETDNVSSADKFLRTKRHCGSTSSNAKSQRCSDCNWRKSLKQSYVCSSKDPGSSNEATSLDIQRLNTPNATHSKRLLATFFDQPCVELARNLLGKYVVRISPEDGKRLSGRIVETEGYVGTEDRASHSYGGRRTARNEAMYMSPGTSYVYNIYGIYTCMNISSRGDGTAVLIRALEPTEGLDTMKKNRGLGDKGDKVKLRDLCGGPSKLTKALSILKSNGDQVDFATCSYLWLEDGDQVPDSDIIACTRIGIGNYAEEWTNKPLRFYVRNCCSVSVRSKAAEKATNT